MLQSLPLALSGGWIALIVLAVVAVWFIGLYNGLVRLKNIAKEAWAQIDVQLKRRHDLIPNLVETAKGYMKHERETLEAVIQARNAAVAATEDPGQGPAQVAAAENMLTGVLRQFFALSEAYPDLKANTNMLQVQEELTSTENRIGFSRQHYNDSVMTYNTKTESFPANIIAGMFSFKDEAFFEIEDEAAREVPKVQF